MKNLLSSLLLTSLFLSTAASASVVLLPAPQPKLNCIVIGADATAGAFILSCDKTGIMVAMPAEEKDPPPEAVSPCNRCHGGKPVKKGRRI